MIKTEKTLHLRRFRGRKVRVVREHYLREQVPCFSSLCQADCANGKVHRIYAGPKHEHMPDLNPNTRRTHEHEQSVAVIDVHAALRVFAASVEASSDPFKCAFKIKVGGLETLL